MGRNIEPGFNTGDESGGKRTLLICDRAIDASAYAEGHLPCSDTEMYPSLIAAALDSTSFDVVLHLQHRDSAALCASMPVPRGRVRAITGVPLQQLLPMADVLVAFASSAAIEGGKHGLKPVQIGRFLTGSDAFSHICTDVDDFTTAMRAKDFSGTMSLEEFADFEAFRQNLAHRTRNTDRDAVALACRQPAPVRRSSSATIGAAMANPLAAIRLVRAGLRSAPEALPGNPPEVARKPLVAGHGGERAG